MRARCKTDVPRFVQIWACIQKRRDILKSFISVSRVMVLSLVFIFWSEATWMAFKSKYHMAYVTSRYTLAIKIHYKGVRHHWDASQCIATFGRLKIWRLRERAHYTVVILNNLLSLAQSPLLIHNAYDLQLARKLSLLWYCERVCIR